MSFANSASSCEEVAELKVVVLRSSFPFDFLVIPISESASELSFMSWSNFLTYFFNLSEPSISEYPD